MIELKKKKITRIFWNCTKKKSWRDILRLEISFFNIIIKYSADQWTSNPYNHFIMTAREISFENAAAFNRKKRRRRKRLSYIYIYISPRWYYQLFHHRLDRREKKRRKKKMKEGRQTLCIIRIRKNRQFTSTPKYRLVLTHICISISPYIYTYIYIHRYPCTCTRGP